MYRLLVLAFSASLAAADVGLGYNYYKPQTYFGPYRGLVDQGSASSSQYNVGYNNANGFNYPNNVYPGLYAGFQNTANTVYQASGVNQGFKPAIIKGDVVGSNSAFQNTVNRYQGVYNTGNVYKESAAYHGGNLGNFGNLNEINKAQSSYQLQSQQAQIFKHFYVHAAPEDDEPIKPRTPVVLPPPQKHYKIIFIKAPTQLSSSPQILPVQQNEEKTIVYVLVNKPEEAQNVIVPKVEQKPPAKPEVYFIKYNTKEGSQAVIDNIVKDYNKDQSVSFTNLATGVAPPSPVLLGTFGSSGVQTGNSGNAVSSGVQNTEHSGFSGFSTQSSYESKPLTVSTSGISDGTLASIQLDNGYNGASSGLNVGSSNTGYTGSSENTGFSGALTSTGLNSASSATLNGESGISGFGSSTNSYNSAPNGNEYSTVSGVLTATGGAQSVTDSGYNGATISTSQGLPHETYGIPKFNV